MRGQLYTFMRTGVWEDLYTSYGIIMGDGFLDKLDEPNAMKEYVTDESRLLHGKEVIIDDLRVDAREVSLTFVITTDNGKAYDVNKKAFYSLLEKGELILYVARLNTTFRLIYTGKSISYGVTPNRTLGKLTVSFDEPNPKNRQNGKIWA